MKYYVKVLIFYGILFSLFFAGSMTGMYPKPYSSIILGNNLIVPQMLILMVILIIGSNCLGYASSYTISKLLDNLFILF